MDEPNRKEDELRPVWVMTLLIWMAAGFGIYFFKMLTLPGRMERLVQLLQPLLRLR